MNVLEAVLPIKVGDNVLVDEGLLKTIDCVMYSKWKLDTCR